MKYYLNRTKKFDLVLTALGESTLKNKKLSVTGSKCIHDIEACEERGIINGKLISVTLPCISSLFLSWRHLTFVPVVVSLLATGTTYVCYHNTLFATKNFFHTLECIHLSKQEEKEDLNSNRSIELEDVELGLKSCIELAIKPAVVLSVWSEPMKFSYLIRVKWWSPKRQDKWRAPVHFAHRTFYNVDKLDSQLSSSIQTPSIWSV